MNDFPFINIFPVVSPETSFLHRYYIGNVKKRQWSAYDNIEKIIGDYVCHIQLC